LVVRAFRVGTILFRGEEIAPLRESVSNLFDYLPLIFRFNETLYLPYLLRSTLFESEGSGPMNDNTYLNKGDGFNDKQSRSNM